MNRQSNLKELDKYFDLLHKADCFYQKTNDLNTWKYCVILIANEISTYRLRNYDYR